MSNRNQFEQALTECPVIAILRGVEPDDVIGIADALYRAGVRIVEVPLNSPNPLESIKRLVSELGEQMVIGAGTVTDRQMVDAVGDVGGQIIVSPNTNENVLARSKILNMVAIPGVMTPTEMFYAAKHGAKYLKLFPADQLGPSFVKAVRATLPDGLRLIAVGGVDETSAPNWLQAGVVGLGCGGSLFKPGDAPKTVYERAVRIVAATRSEVS